MGFRDLLNFNKAMLGKQAWRLFTNPSSLWSKVFKGIYFHSRTFYNAEQGSRPSWGWQSLLTGRDAILPNIRWSVGDGRSINIRGDRWLPMGVLGGPMVREEPQFVADLIDQHTGTWNVTLLGTFFDNQVSDQISTIPIRPHCAKDQLMWTATKDVSFTVKTAYHTITASSTSQTAHSTSTSYQNPSWLWKKL